MKKIVIGVLALSSVLAAAQQRPWKPSGTIKNRDRGVVVVRPGVRPPLRPGVRPPLRPVYRPDIYRAIRDARRDRFIFLTGLAIIGMLMTFRLVQEEALLARRFGREYLAYRERTGRFVPRLRGRGTPGGKLIAREPGPRAPAPPGAPPPGRRRSRSPRTGSARPR